MLDKYHCQTHSLCCSVRHLLKFYLILCSAYQRVDLSGLETCIHTEPPQFGFKDVFTCTVCILYHPVACIYAERFAA